MSRTDPRDIFHSYSRFIGEILNGLYGENGAGEAVYEVPRPSLRKENHDIFHTEDMYEIFSFILISNNRKTIHEFRELDIDKSITAGRYEFEEGHHKKLLDNNPLLQFYMYALLKDEDQKYHIGYFKEYVRIMMRTIVELNILFFDVYLVCRMMDMFFHDGNFSLNKKDLNWSFLTSRSNKQPLALTFNNILKITYPEKKLHVTVLQEGLRHFKSYSSGKINLGLYAGDKLLFCQPMSVPNFSDEHRELILNDKIGGKDQKQWAEIISELDKEDMEKCFKDLTDWFSLAGAVAKE